MNDTLSEVRSSTKNLESALFGKIIPARIFRDHFKHIQNGRKEIVPTEF